MNRAETIYQDSLVKKQALLEAGVDLYPATSSRTHLIGQVLASFNDLGEQPVVIAGRLSGKRVHGGAAFLDIFDQSGQIQAFISASKVGEALFKQVKDLYDEGDVIEVKGVAMVTKAGEKSLAAETLRILAKSLKPLPKAWFGLKDKEARLRQRYLDLLLNQEVRQAFKLRSRLITQLRRCLDAAGFFEVETPILQTLPGGALAKPFSTHLNALDLEMFLRVAPELYLKRLLVGGFEQVYELGRAFRNEGMDSSHNPEFTILEFYWAYKDREALMKFTEELFEAVVTAVVGGLVLKTEAGELNFAGPWPRVAFLDLLKEHTQVDYDAFDRDGLAKVAEGQGLKIEPGLSKGKIADELFKKKCRPHLTQPTFVFDHPLEISPLAKRSATNPRRAARFQLVIQGNEYVNAYSELNDPVEQAERFKAQEQDARAGDAETQPFDADFIEALEYGMPPAAGWGLGVDRLAALLTGQASLREIILFPTMRPRS